MALDEPGHLLALDPLDVELADDAGLAAQDVGQRELVIELALAREGRALIAPRLTLDERADVLESHPHAVHERVDLGLSLRVDRPHVVAVPADGCDCRDQDAR